jgi:hypothetical protein
MLFLHSENDRVLIKSNDFWVKVVEMLQQNWALIDREPDAPAQVFFIHDHSGVFDQMLFPSVAVAERALLRNGFERFSANPDFAKFLRPPCGPYYRDRHPNGPIYSSGRFWRP